MLRPCIGRTLPLRDWACWRHKNCGFSQRLEYKERLGFERKLEFGYKLGFSRQRLVFKEKPGSKQK
jgi:hypothetical protein